MVKRLGVLKSIGGPRGVKVSGLTWLLAMQGLSAWAGGQAGPAPVDEFRHAAAMYEARCGGCHAIDANRVGPMHRQLLGRTAGRVPGYDYSPALRASGLVWDAKNLDLWLRDPEALIPGQSMNYRVDSAEDRRLLIGYLGSPSVSAPSAARRAPN